MNWELDHVFIATTDPMFETLAHDFGLTFSEHRTHQGQGTSNACAIFQNAFFELLFGVDDNELESEVVRPLALSERVRWRHSGACPFGLCFRPTRAEPGVAMPFETWSYRPPYVPSGSSIPVAKPRRNLVEPLVFLMTRPRPAAAWSGGAPHRGSNRTLTSVALQSPHGFDSPALRWLTEEKLLSVSQGSEYLMDLVWDEGRAGHIERLPAPVPLRVRW